MADIDLVQIVVNGIDVVTRNDSAADDRCDQRR